VVGVAPELRAGRSGVRIPVEERNYSLLQNIQADSGAHTAPIQWIPVISWGKGAEGGGREADHPPPFAVEVMNKWS
jgi:hypothetical protein